MRTHGKQQSCAVIHISYSHISGAWLITLRGRLDRHPEREQDGYEVAAKSLSLYGCDGCCNCVQHPQSCKAEARRNTKKSEAARISGQQQQHGGYRRAVLFFLFLSLPPSFEAAGMQSRLDVTSQTTGCSLDVATWSQCFSYDTVTWHKSCQYDG